MSILGVPSLIDWNVCFKRELALTESKLDFPFPTNQILIEGYFKPFRCDRNRNGGGILLYIRKDPVNNAVRKYENYPGVKKISEAATITSTFHFSSVDKADVEKSIGNLNSSKVGTSKNIPIKYLQ